MGNSDKIREEILGKVKEYYASKFDKKESFVEGETKIHYAGRVFDENEIMKVVDSALDFWLTSGRFCEEFEKRLADFLGAKYCSLVNSGSSASLAAFYALTSHKLKERRIKKGDEVITVSASFPTTISPAIQYGVAPVFLDVELGTYNIDCDLLEEALSEKTKAVILAHTLGNPFDLKRIINFCKENSLWLIEDNCDSLGAKYQGKYVGTFGDIGTSSFYPAHHLTMGEGGAVYTNNPEINKILDSFINWGKDCCCPTGRDNTCGKRFGQQFGELPFGYDHKYVFSHFGFNLKLTEMQAAIGCAQLDKLPGFIRKRNENFQKLYTGLKEFDDKIILPESLPETEPSWFSFPITIKDNTKYDRKSIISFLESNHIQTRLLFGGNMIKQPCFDEMRKSKQGYRVVGDLKNTDKIMNDTFMVGVYPGLDDKMIDYMIKKIKSFLLEKH